MFKMDKWGCEAGPCRILLLVVGGLLATLLIFGFQARAEDGEFTHLEEDDKAKVELQVLHPLQKGLGLLAVQEKYERLKAKSEEKLTEYLKKHPVPVVVGPGGHRLYLIDHHHLSLACHMLGIEKIRVVVVKNKSDLTMREFEAWLKKKKYVYLYDENDKHIRFNQLPNTIPEMKDDPYRSLAGVVEDEGGFEKTGEPFMEFTWARFYRKYFTVDQINTDFEKTVKAAVEIAHSEKASHLPGYVGSAQACVSSLN